MISDPILGCYGIGGFVDWLSSKFATKNELNADSGVTAGSYGPTANATPEAGGSIVVPQVTVDKRGRVTGAADRTITLPAGGGGGGEEQFQKVYETTLTEASAATGVEITSGDMGGAYFDALVVVSVVPSASGFLQVSFADGSIEHGVGDTPSLSSGQSTVVMALSSEGGLVYINETVDTGGSTMLRAGFYPILFPSESFSEINKVFVEMQDSSHVATAIPSGTTITVYARKKVTE